MGSLNTLGSNIGDAATAGKGMYDGFQQARENSFNQTASMVDSAKDKFVNYIGDDNMIARATGSAIGKIGENAADNIRQSGKDRSMPGIPELENTKAPDAEKIHMANQAPDAEQMLNILMQKANN